MTDQTRPGLALTFHSEVVERIIEILGAGLGLEPNKLSVLFQYEVSLSPVLYMFSWNNRPKFVMLAQD